MVGHYPLFDFRVQTAIDTTDALHEPNGVPVQVVVDHPRRVLEVQTFGQHVGGDEDADFRFSVVGKFGAGGSVVVRGESPDDIATALLAAAIDCSTR